MHIRSFIWTSDSRSIIFQATAKTGADRDLMFRQIYRVQVPGGIPRKIVATTGKLGMMSVSPDTEKLAYLGAVSENDPLAQNVFVIPIKGGKTTLLTDGFKESVQSVDWVDDETLLLKSLRGSKTALSIISITSSSPEGIKEQTDVLTQDLIVRSVRYNRNTEKLILTGNKNNHPTELFAGSIKSGGVRRLTYSNLFLDEVNLAAQEVITWESQDGMKIEGVLTYPLNYREGKRYPLILMIHGGPEGTSLDGWTTGSLYPVQLLAAEGYMVLQPNYRGSGGRGVVFSKGDHDDLGGMEYMDVLSGIDYLAERNMIDPQHVGTGGWSYGGYFSAWGATAHSVRFKAAMVGAGLTNWISFAGTTDIPYEMSVVHWDSWWYDEMDLHWERSPLAHINNAQTPTLVIHGQKDDRVHPEQSRELWQALRLKGIATELVIYPREPHGLLERAHKLDYMDRLVNWYNKYVK
ncbi:MAG: S9 family peptidase [Candidatus Neomarinimicrobiota bacterium]